jgi:hypothetical protein
LAAGICLKHWRFRENVIKCEQTASNRTWVLSSRPLKLRQAGEDRRRGHRSYRGWEQLAHAGAFRPLVLACMAAVNLSRGDKESGDSLVKNHLVEYQSRFGFDEIKSYSPELYSLKIFRNQQVLIGTPTVTLRI